MKGKMSSRDRVLAFFDRVEPDRVPINYFANQGLDRRLKRHFGLGEDDHESLRLRLGVDLRGTFVRYTGPKLHPDPPDRHVDEWGIRTRWIGHGQGGYWDVCDFPLQQATLEEVEAWPLPSPDHYDVSHVQEVSETYDKFGLFIGGQGVACVINRAARLRGMEQVLVDLITDDPAGLRLIQRKQDIELETTRRAIEAGKGAFDFLWIGEDLGSQIGPLISLELYRKRIKSLHQAFVDLAKAHGLKVMIHTCGSSSWAYDDFIEMGIDAVETLQPEAKDMSPNHLKTRYGAHLSFHGCISTAGAVSFGAPEDVRKEVQDTLSIMMPGGGYCLSPTHLFQDNTPTENVVALYEAAHEYGVYGKP